MHISMQKDVWLHGALMICNLNLNLGDHVLVHAIAC